MDEASRSEAKRCGAKRKDGRPCAARVMGAGEHCFAHDPRRVAQRDQARRKGGANSATAARAEKLVPAVLRPVLVTLLQTLQGAQAGTIEPRRATAIGSVARAIVAVYQVGTLEERLQALEAARATHEEGGPA